MLQLRLPLRMSVSRALDLVIAKCTSLGGDPCDVFTKLLDAVDCPVLNCCAPLWDIHTCYCVDAVQNREHKNCSSWEIQTNNGVTGDNGWTPFFFTNCDMTRVCSRLNPLCEDSIQHSARFFLKYHKTT